MTDINPEVPKQVSLFPVSPETAEGFLKQIELDPLKAYVETIETLKGENHQLYEFIQGVAKESSIEYEEGAIFAYALLQQEALFKGLPKLPYLTEGDIKSFLKSDEDNFGELPTTHKGDVAFEGFLRILGKYRLNRAEFEEGAADCFRIIERHFEAKKLEEAIKV